MDLYFGAALGFSCGVWAFCWSSWTLIVERGLSYSMVCGILVLQQGAECIPCIARKILNQWATREVPYMDLFFFNKHSHPSV